VVAGGVAGVVVGGADSVTPPTALSLLSLPPQACIAAATAIHMARLRLLNVFFTVASSLFRRKGGAS
jgi:hypothetical protein